MTGLQRVLGGEKKYKYRLFSKLVGAFNKSILFPYTTSALKKSRSLIDNLVNQKEYIRNLIAKELCKNKLHD